MVFIYESSEESESKGRMHCFTHLWILLNLSQILDLKINSERVFQSRFKNRVPLSRIFYVFKQAAQAAGLSRLVGVLDIKATAKRDYELCVEKKREELLKEADEIRKDELC